MTNILILTSRQTSELHKAIIQYLQPILTASDDDEVLAKLITTLDVDPTTLHDIIPNYLEKKWSTVLRLQKRILDLETDLDHVKSSMEDQPEIVNAKGKINWLPSTVKLTFKTQSHQQINTVAMHPFLPIIACGCSDGSIIVWNLAVDDTLPEKVIKAHTRSVNKLVWSSNPIDIHGNNTAEYYFASCSSDLSIKLWNGSTYKQVRNFLGHEHTVSSLSFSSSPLHAKLLYSVSRDKTIKIWDVVNATCIKSFVGHSDWVRNVDTIALPESPLGDFMVTCSNDQSIRLSHCDLGTGLCLLVGHGHVVEDVKFLPLHGNQVIDEFIQHNMPRFQSIPPNLLSDPIYLDTLGFKYCLSAGRDNTIKLWLLPPPTMQPHRPPMPSKYNNSQGWLIDNLVGHTSWVKSLSIHPNGRFIFSGSDDKTIKIWDLQTLKTDGKVKCIKTLHGHDGFISCSEFASFETDEKIPSIKQLDEFLKYTESKMRCLFITGSVDNSVKLWK